MCSPSKTLSEIRNIKKVIHNVLFRKVYLINLVISFIKSSFFIKNHLICSKLKIKFLFYTHFFNYFNKFQEFLFPLARYRRFATIAPLRGRYYICNYKPKFFFAINSYMLFPNIK